jgi:Putative Flp pilus-assembly TadE/G-like
LKGIDINMDRRNGRNGQALLAVTVAMVLLMGVLGLGVDLGWAYYRRDAAQSAADGAAAAVIRAAVANSPGAQTCGSSRVWCGSPAGTATACPSTTVTTASSSFDNGCMMAAANGFTSTVTIQANTTTSAPTVPGTTVSYWATVRVSETPTTMFSRLIQAGGLTYSVRASAGVTSTGSATTAPCIYLLSQTGTNPLTIGNGVHLSTSSCGVYINSSAASALSVTGGATLTSPSIKIYTPGGGTPGTTVNNGGTTSTPPVGVLTRVADPFLSVLPPTVAGSCTAGNFTAYQATAYTPAPGTYCGFSVGNGMSAVLSSGVYVVNGGTLSIQGGSTLTGTAGVMFYLTGGATVNIGNGALVTMSAASSGTYQGMLFYQDRTMTTPGESYFTGGASMHLTGSLYFPNALLAMDNGSNTQTEAIIANSLSMQGGATLQQATSTSQTGLPVGTNSVSIIE